MSHIKTWACIKPDGDGCDGDHIMTRDEKIEALAGNSNNLLKRSRGMGMFNFTIINRNELRDLKVQASRYQSLLRYSYWFSGFQATYELLADFSRGSIESTNIWEKREEFARKMGTDRYGKSPTPEGEKEK